MWANWGNIYNFILFDYVILNILLQFTSLHTLKHILNSDMTKCVQEPIIAVQISLPSINLVERKLSYLINWQEIGETAVSLLNSMWSNWHRNQIKNVFLYQHEELFKLDIKKSIIQSVIMCVLLQSYYLFSCCLLDLKTSWCSFKFHHSRQILSLCVIWEIDLPSLTRRELNSFIFIHKGFMKKLPFPLKCRTTAHQKRSQAV